ncbi:ras GTPase-activating-like protein IQGAP2 [Haemaphysalis longicornis]
MSSAGQDVYDELRPSSDEMDERRQPRMDYLYLCHLEETRLWLSSFIEEELPSAKRPEDSLRNGIYDADKSVLREQGRCFRHTYINRWLKAMRSINFPEYFFPEPFDLYEKKSQSNVIYCLHGPLPLQAGQGGQDEEVAHM